MHHVPSEQDTRNQDLDFGSQQHCIVTPGVIKAAGDVNRALGIRVVADCVATHQARLQATTLLHEPIFVILL